MMNCKRARLAIALSVGNDLDENGEGELQRHLAGCPSCRMHRHDLEGSLGVLQTRPQEDQVSLRDSVWPAVSVRLSPVREQRFNGWIPAVALAASILMMVAVVREPQPVAPVGGGPYGVPFNRVDFGIAPRLPAPAQADVLLPGNPGLSTGSVQPDRSHQSRRLDSPRRRDARNEAASIYWYEGGH